MHRPLIAACAALTLGACATPTVYGPANPNGSMAAQVGYSEYKIENNRYRITFQGGQGAPQRQVVDYALLRAAEVTIRDGYEWFQVVNQFGGPSKLGGNTSMSVGTGTGNISRHTSVGVGIGTTFDLSGGPAYSHTLEIIEGNGEKPASPEVYDARALAAALAPAPH